MADEPVIQHHYHAPSNKAVTAAVFQYLNIRKEIIEDLIHSTILLAIDDKLKSMFTGDRWKAVLEQAVINHIRANNPALNQTAGAVNFVKSRIDDVVREEILKRLVITVTAKPENQNA